MPLPTSVQGTRVAVRVAVPVLVGRAVEVLVTVAVAVSVGVSVTVAVSVTVDVMVNVLVWVFVNVGVSGFMLPSDRPVTRDVRNFSTTPSRDVFRRRVGHQSLNKGMIMLWRYVRVMRTRSPGPPASSI